MRRGYATQGAVQPGPVFMEDAKGNRYDVAGNIVPPAQDPVTDALSVARREVVDPYAEEIASAKKLMADKAYQEQSWGDWASDAGKNLYETGMSFLPTALGGRGEVGLTDIAKGAYESAKSGVTLPGDVLAGRTKVFDPRSGDVSEEVLRRGADFTGFMTLGAGAIPAEANTLRMGMKGPPKPEDAEAAALKAAQDAVGEDQAAAATRAAQIEALNPVPPPQDIAPPTNALQTERGARTVIAPTSIKLTPQEQAVVNSFKSKADRAVVAARIRETKARYPKSDGWAPFEATGASFDDKGNPVIEWQEQSYGFNTAVQPGNKTITDPITGEKSTVQVNEPRALRPGSANYEALARRATRNGVREVEDIIRRAGEGDENALRIIRQAGWYREFMRKGFDERGGSYPAFSDLLGATSPNTAVDQNYRYSVDIQNRFARGDFDKEVAFARDYQGDLNEFPKESLIFRNPVGPRGPQKLQYGMNSRNAQMALADKWRKKEPNQAPKARNFSGNLGGGTDQATIDVWAARFINRITGRKRLPPPVEGGVGGKLGSKLEPTGEFGFGQDVFRRITDELNRKGNLLPYLRELGYDRLTPMDMQALTWFIEKERWTKNNWTTAAGEGGSFEDELLKYPSERWQSGVSIEQKGPPSDEAMAYTRNVFENSLRDDPNVNQYRVHPTIGRYDGYNERSFDLELTAKPGWSPRTWMAAVIREAQKNNQKDVFFSKRLSPEAANNNPNARPGVEIYFRDRKTLKDAMPILEEFTKRNADGFTFVTDLRLRERELGGKEAPDFVGVRMQWVPEIRSRFDEDFRNAVAADPGVLDVEKIAALNSMQNALDALDKAGLGVVDARVHHYDTLTIGKESYDKFLEGIEDPDNAAGNYEGSSGAAVDPVKRFGQSIYSHVEGRNRALRAGSEGGQSDTGGDVVGAGQSSGAITPEQAAQNFDAAFGQTYLKDPSGKPMRLYHMTPGDIREFSASPENRSGPVVFLSPYADFQPAYHQAAELGERGEFTSTFKEGANVMPVYADVRNPLVLDHPRKIREAAAKYQGGDRKFPRIITPEAKAAMEADGFDAIIFGGDNPIPYGNRAMDARLGHQEARDEEFIIFDPKKIKSAIGNKGTYDLTKGDITKAYGGALVDDEDIDNALRLARAMGGRTGYAEAGSVPVLMEDAKGNKYDAQGNIIPPTNPGPNPARNDVTPQSVAAKAVNDPATYDALMERYAIPDRDIAEYEALRETVGKQPQSVQQMTHVGDRPRREMTIDMPLFGGEYSMGTAPYDVASGISGAAQTAYDLKTAPFYFNPFTAPIAAGMDVAEGIATNDPLTASLAIAFGPGGKYAKAAGIGATNYFMNPDEAEAGPERWFSKAMEVARAIPMEKMTGQQALAMLRKGVSPEELKWTGADAFLPQQKQITKQDLVDYLAKNRVQTRDVVLGGSKPTNIYDIVPSEEVKAKYQPQIDSINQKLLSVSKQREASLKFPFDDENYISEYTFRQERDKLLDELSGVQHQMRNDAVSEIGGLGLPTKYQDYSTAGGEGYTETLYQLGRHAGPSKVVRKGPMWHVVGPDGETLRNQSGKPYTYYNQSEAERAAKSMYRESGTYQSPHWNEPDVFAHTRSNTLTYEPPGSNRPYKVHNVEETQSDLAQAGRKRGFKDQNAMVSVARLRQETHDLNDKLSDAMRNLVQEHYENIQPLKDAHNAYKEAMTTRYGRGEISIRELNDLVDENYNQMHAQMDPFISQYRAKEDAIVEPLRRQIAAKGEEIDRIGKNIGDMPLMPYVSNTEGWTDFAIKKELDRALDSDADYFSWSPGEVHAERYDLSKHISRVQYNPDDGSLLAYDPKGKMVINESVNDPDDLDEYLGKELADKMRLEAESRRSVIDEYEIAKDEETGEWGVYLYGEPASETFPSKGHARDYLNELVANDLAQSPAELSGLDLKVGGEGMRGYYDKIYLKRVQDVIKKSTGIKPEIETITVNTADGPRQQLGVRITDEMREKARFSDFNKGGRVADPVVNKALSLTRY